MTATQPRISVVIPVYNMAEYVPSAVKSVLVDPWPNKEIIVVDDGSVDGSGDAAEACGDEVKVIRQKNQGAAAALNNGFVASSGDYFCWLSADDLFISGKMAAQAATLLADPCASATQTDSETIDAHGQHLAFNIANSYCDKTSLYRLLLGNDINGSTMMIRRAVFEEMGRFDTTFRADVDGAMWMKMMARRHAIARTPGVFGKYRWHSGNLSHNTALMKECMDGTRLAVIQEHWERVQWWNDGDDRWWDTLILALHMQKCEESARLVEEKKGRPMSVASRLLLKGIYSTNTGIKRVARKLGRMGAVRRRAIALRETEVP